MPLRTQEQGSYELFETTKGHRILVLQGDKWLAWVQGQRGEILVRSDADHKKKRSLQRGQFHLVDFEEDPTYKDMPHLFLQDGDQYQELMVPNGLPTDEDHQKKVVKTDETLPKEKLESYLEDPAPAGPGEKRISRPGGSAGADVMRAISKGSQTSDLPITDYDDLAVREVTGRLDGLNKDDLIKLKTYEQHRKDRKTVKQALDRRLKHDG